MKTSKRNLRQIQTIPVLSNFGIACVEPEFGINLGYVARCMANFGIRNLILIGSRQAFSDNWLSEARLFAAHGRAIIDNIGYVKNLKFLKSKFDIVIGTTAIEARRKSNLLRRTLDVQECAAKISDRLALKKDRACIVFGRDTTGLTNDELRLCDYTATIRTSSNYNTLNLSHAAAIVFYVFANTFREQKNALNAILQEKSMDSFSSSTREQRERAIRLFEQLSFDAEFRRCA